MTTWKLVPKPWGYYAIAPDGPCAPDIENELDFLMSGDDHNNVGPWSLRAEVLIVAVDEPMEATKTA